MYTLLRLVLSGCLLLSAPLAAEAGNAMSPHPGWTNLASGKKVEFALEPNDADVKDEADVVQLTDGQFSAADPIWYDREERMPVGWTGPKEIEFQVDLGAIAPIRGVSIRVGAGKSGVAWPESVKVYVSDDGEKYAPVADLMETTPDIPAPDSYSASWLEADKLKTHGRYVKFVVQPKDSGHGIYFYTDEVEVYRGEPAWLSLPLPTPEKKANPSSPRPKLTNLATGMEVALNSEPNVPDVNDMDDAKQLVDGELSKGTPIWTEKSTVGWMGEKMVEFTVDLGKDQPISGVALHMAAGHAGVEWPANIELYVSQDGGDFTSLGDVMLLATEKPSEGDGYKAAWIVTDKLETHGRYVKFIISPNNQGNGSYVFLDEVEIYRGKDEWLSRPLAGVSRPEQWQADWTQLTWKVAPGLVPESERPRPVVLVDGKTITGEGVLLQNVESTSEGATFSLKGEAGKPRAMSWQAKLAEPLSAEKCQYVLLTFKAEGIRRVYTPKALVSLQGMAREAGSNEVAILDSNTPLNDGLSHTIIRKLPEGFVLKQLAVSVVTDDDLAKLTLERLEFLQDVPAIFNPTIVSGGKIPEGFIPVSLGSQANGSVAAWFREVLSRYKAVQDGASDVAAGVLTASGAPFLMGDPEKNLVMMPESKPSDARVSFLGQDVDKRFLEPASRHDTLSIDVDGKAREVLLLLATASPLNQVRGGIPTRALKLDDQESLMVELTYEDGTTSLAFPYSIADRSCYIPARELNAFAVAADPSRRLQKVTLHNRHFGPAFAIAGLTLNTSAELLAPLLANIPATEPTAKNPEPADAPLEVTVEGNRLVIANKWYRYEFDLAQGFVLDRLINRWNPAANISLGKSSGLRIRMGDTIYTGRCFRAAVEKITPSGVELKLTSLRPALPLEIKVTIAADATQELRFVARGRNLGDTPLAAELVLPAVADLALGTVADTRAFFPQYRTVDTAESIYLRSPYGPEFAVQFMDVYNPKLGVGLMFRTDNVTQRMLDFSMSKNAEGVSSGVHFPAAYNEIAPNAIHEYPKVSLFTHDRDWHAAEQLYTNWVRSWYKPDRSQDKQLFLNAWDLMCYRTSNYLSWMDSRVPPFITADRTKWMTEESLAFEEKRLGHVPDFIHFFNWTYNDKKKQNEYGVFGTPLAYEQVGGLEFFKEGIANIQTKWNRPVSLYTLPDRIRISSIPDKELADDLVKQAWHKEIDTNDQSNVVRASGSVDGIVFLQPANERWIDFFVSDLVAMQRDTGCKLVYLDVFPSFSHLKGFNGASPRDGDMVMIKRLRNELPADVVIWTEYPLTDVASQYADGCLQYYFMDTSEVFARRYNMPDTVADLITEMPFNVQRFSTPTYKTIGLPTYIETGSKPSQVDATFFNGEAFQEDTYRLHHSRIRERLNRGYVVKKEYTDCFNSPNPQPRVYTPVGGMYANLFPGQDRNLWTFFNGRPQTYSGTVIEVPHREGATYRDAWNGRELKPVIENGMAKIALTINPQEAGCVVQDWREPAKDLARAKDIKEGEVK